MYPKLIFSIKKLPEIFSKNNQRFQLNGSFSPVQSQLSYVCLEIYKKQRIIRIKKYPKIGEKGERPY